MKRKNARRALDLLRDTLAVKARETRKKRTNYAVPALWDSPKGRGKREKVQPFSYYLRVVDRIRKAKPIRRGRPTGGEWTAQSVVYNMFVRTTTAFDHNGNGGIDLPVNGDGLRETGTFLKAIAMLPYIKRLGATTIHLLPITSIGHDGNKGNLGSPYAIRNPYELDENLSEPALGLDARTEFRAFVEAAHRLGFRVVVEFVFRTAAKDSDWVKEHPEWMYWIREEIATRPPGITDEGSYGSPLFTKEELDRIHADVREGKLDALIPPHPQYRAFFTAPPASEQVLKESGRYLGTLPDGSRVKIPGAFADWPPDDNQPPWGDVTYLRLYNHRDYNYIGYNTIRMYDTRLARPEFVNRPLWDRITGIIPYYQREFRIDGVMIDMGHALPMELKSEIVSRARTIDPDFAFWDENFSVTAKSRAEGYNIVFGFCWIDQHHPEKMKNLLRKCAGEGFPIPFFATPENHNTPRAVMRPGGRTYARWAMVVNAFLPAVPFIHSGYEIGEAFPINTGLDFTNEELGRYPSEQLPLFSAHAYDWLNREEFTGWVKQALALRAKYRSIVADQRPSTVRIFEEAPPPVLAFARIAPNGRTRIAIICNMNAGGSESIAIPLQSERKHLTDLLEGKRLPLHDGVLSLHLAPGESVVAEY